MVPLRILPGHNGYIDWRQIEILVRSPYARVVPGSDLPKKDIDINVLREFEPPFDAWKIIRKHDHACSAWHLNDAAVDLLRLGWRKRLIAGREIHRTGPESGHALAGPHGIIVDANVRLSIFEIIDPAIHQRGDEGRASAAQFHTFGKSRLNQCSKN